MLTLWARYASTRSPHIYVRYVTHVIDGDRHRDERQVMDGGRFGSLLRWEHVNPAFKNGDGTNSAPRDGRVMCDMQTTPVVCRT